MTVVIMFTLIIIIITTTTYNDYIRDLARDIPTAEMCSGVVAGRESALEVMVPDVMLRRRLHVAVN